MAERAYGRDDKAARRRVILRAAAELFRTGAGELPTMTDIAVCAGLAKGTTYLYFRTKEAIFSTVLLEGWGEVFDLVDEVFGAASGTPSALTTDFLARLAGYLERHPELLRLDALGHAVLKARLPPEERRALAAAYDDRLTRSGATLDGALALPLGRGERLLARTYALIRGLWQSFDEAQADRPRVGIAFYSELREALDEYWRGALGDKPDAPVEAASNP